MNRLTLDQVIEQLEWMRTTMGGDSLIDDVAIIQVAADGREQYAVILKLPDEHETRLSRVNVTDIGNN